MAKKSGESKAPLVIALAFFVLATLALGVLTYLAYGEIAIAKASEKKAKEAADAAAKLQAQDSEKILVYKVALGVANEEDRTNLQNVRSIEAVKKEHTLLVSEAKKRIDAAITDQAKKLAGGGGEAPKLAITADEVFKWEWPDGGNLEPQPNAYVLDQIVNFYVNQQLAKRDLTAKVKGLESATKEAIDAKAAYETAKAETTKKFEEVPPKLVAAIEKYNADVEDIRKGYQASMKKYEGQNRANEDEKAKKDLEIRKLGEEVNKQALRIADQDAKLEVKEDPFAYDKPHGRIVRRRNNVVQIDLGSADNVRPGLTFSVQPSDTPERGLQSRMKSVRGENGIVENQVVPKAFVEVTEVLGPNASIARITSEANSIREGVLAGDALYNSAWRKGGADHVALFGIFDTDGDGTDDIKQVARDLSKMGVIVDAYYDLEQKKWVGQITERTIFAIEGFIPFKVIQAGESPGIIAAKGGVREGLEKARKEAKERGSKVVKNRDFFPRIGYFLKLDIPEERIDQAAARYLLSAPAEAPAPAN